MASTGSQATDRLKEASGELFKALGDRTMSKVSHSVEGLADRLDGVADGGPVKGLIGGAVKSKAEGGSPTGGALKGALSGIKDKVTGGGGGGGGKGKPETKATTILEDIDVGVPVSVAYNQWTEFASFPQMMRKVEKVEAEEDTKLNWKAQIVWSHRTWEATIVDQVPDERIVWKSKGEKGHVDGAVTFHELAPNLTRISLTLEYFPQGLFERTGNIWRAQGRRARSELKRFRQHVMTQTVLDEEELEGWRGEIHDGEVERSHEDVVEEEQQQDEGQEQSDQPEDQGAPEDDYDDEEPDAEEDSDEPEDEYDEGDEPEEPEEPEDEADYEESDEDVDDSEDADEYEDEPEDEADEPEAYEDEQTEDEPEEDETDEDYEEPEDEPEDLDEEPDEEPEDEPEDLDEEPDEEPEEARPAPRGRRR